MSGSALAYLVHRRRGPLEVDRIRRYYSFRLTFGGRGWVEMNSVVVRRSAAAVAQFIKYHGHANDGASGHPLEAAEFPF